MPEEATSDIISGNYLGASTAFIHVLGLSIEAADLIGRLVVTLIRCRSRFFATVKI